MIDLDAQLQLIAKAAPDLRKAGVLSLTIGDVKLELSTYDPEPTTATTTTPVTPDDPLKDPDLYGGAVPQRRRRPPDKDGFDDDDARER